MGKIVYEIETMIGKIIDGQRIPTYWEGGRTKVNASPQLTEVYYSDELIFRMVNCEITHVSNNRRWAVDERLKRIDQWLEQEEFRKYQKEINQNEKSSQVEKDIKKYLEKKEEPNNPIHIKEKAKGTLSALIYVLLFPLFIVFAILSSR